MSSASELSAVALQSAREARQTIALAMVDLHDVDAALIEDLSFAVAALYRAEVDGAEALRDRLREAAAVVSGVLSRLHAPELATGLDLAGPALAKTLAVLYPARAGLERALSADAEPAPAPEPSPPAMLFERPLAATFPRPRDVAPVVVKRTQLEMAAPEVGVPEDPQRPTRRDKRSPEVGEPLVPERPSARLRRNAVALSPDADAGLVDHQGQVGSASMDERGRREHDRAEFAVDIGLHSATQFFAGISGDLSEGGLFVATYTPSPVGSEIHVSFVLSGVAIRTPAIVAWVRAADAATDSGGPEPGMGLRFYALKDRDRAAIEKFLEMRPPMIYEPSR